MAEEQVQLDAHDRMPKDPRAMRREIAEMRYKIGGTLDVLEHRFTPSYLRQQAMIIIKRKSNETGNRIRHAVRENPWPAVLTGAGLVWMISSVYRRDPAERHVIMREYPPPHEAMEVGREAVADVGDERGYEPTQSRTEQAKDKASEYGRAVGERAASWRDQAGEQGARVREQAGEAASRMGERASHVGRQIQHQTQETASSAWSTMQEYPLVTGLALFAAGLAAGLLTPGTQREDRWMGEQRDELMDAMRDRGEQLWDKGQQVASHAVEQASEEAQRQGLTGSELKEEAQQTSSEEAPRKAEDLGRRAGEVADEATEAARQEARRQGLSSEDKPKGGEGGEQM